MIFRSEIKQNAKEQLRGRWPLAIFVTFCANLLTGVISVVSERFTTNEITFSANILGIVILIIAGPITVGFSKFLLKFARRDESAAINDIFSEFEIFKKALGLYLLVTICIVIGTALFIIPGIIIGLALSQSYFILAEDNSKSITECMKESARIMNGYKWDFFVLQLSFIGWALLCIISCGIGFLWLSPYYSLTTANFYLTIKDR
ncbi:hypothetical protein BH721_02365 [Clostridium baratii]|uniref:DUF975 family protein n=1 Tax=Clostridium baratii TaxID=1561 RepID=UPI0009A3198D|nr:YciC family protein [Clostridium baratii]OPF51354.1 hypothetical protein A1M12_02110 [Clostridium baratii]OPF55571.1 hypothetical protein BH721_02365 [Clostridium baratii]OPF57050.1 hypothetical protein BH724_11065 [Clostridium baratii]OPF60048.1 hypothetical protein BH725_05560 [Clostridium baratii]